MKRPLVGFLALAALFAWLGATQPAVADSKVDAIFARIKQINPGMLDYQADINIQLNAKVSFLPYNPKMSGKYFHKRPDKHKLVLEKAPSYVKKYPNIFGWNLPQLEKFNTRVVGEMDLNGQPTWRIELLPKQGMGDIQKVEIWVNRTNYTVPRQVTYYANDGELAVDVDYKTEGGYQVFETMVANFAFPKVSVQAKATATYANYKFNQNVPDSFFDSKK